MALVKCADCGREMSNTARVCLYCSHEQKGECRSCKYYEEISGAERGICKAADRIDYVSRYKTVCPGVVKKPLFTVPNIEAGMR